MKIKKLLSIGALALTITTCTSISTFAATSTSSKHDAFQSVVTQGLNGEIVFNGVNITATTPVGDYLTDNFISEANTVLSKYEIEISSKDNYTTIQKNIALKIRTLNETEKTKALGEIRGFLNDKLNSFLNLNDAALKNKINYYFKTSNYGKLTIGRNSNNDKTVSLEDRSGNILLQVNSSNINKAKEKLNSVNTYEDLKLLISSYYPEAESYFQTIR